MGTFRIHVGNVPILLVTVCLPGSRVWHEHCQQIGGMIDRIGVERSVLGHSESVYLSFSVNKTCYTVLMDEKYTLHIAKAESGFVVTIPEISASATGATIEEAIDNGSRAIIAALGARKRPPRRPTRAEAS